MSFLQGKTSVNAALRHHSGRMLAFRVADLAALPNIETFCDLVLPHGEVVVGKFNPEPRNPDMTGPDLVAWIRQMTPEGTSRAVLVREVAPDRLAILLDQEGPADSDDKSFIETAETIASLPSDRRRHEYEAWERDAGLRRRLLKRWPHACQVAECVATRDLSSDNRASILEVHHLDHVSAGGDDGPMNLCLICANHHRLIHGGTPTSVVVRSDHSEAVVRVGGIDLTIRRDLSAL